MSDDLQDLPVHLFLDGDLIAYRLAAACQTVDKETQVVTVDKAGAEDGIDKFVAWLKYRWEPIQMSACWSDRQNFRRGVYHPYKSNRSGTQKPELLGHLRERLSSLCDQTLLHVGLEADDLLGINCTEDQDFEHRILVSYDKDMRTLPNVTLFDYRTDGLVTRTTLESADTAFWTQVLTGDSTDGYPGIPGVGPKKAEVLVKKVMALPPEERWHYVTKLFAEFHLDVDYALRQARCARILRDGEFDFERRGVLLFDGKGGTFTPLDELLATS